MMRATCAHIYTHYVSVGTINSLVKLRPQPSIGLSHQSNLTAVTQPIRACTTGSR